MEAELNLPSLSSREGHALLCAPKIAIGSTTLAFFARSLPPLRIAEAAEAGNTF